MEDLDEARTSVERGGVSGFSFWTGLEHFYNDPSLSTRTSTANTIFRNNKQIGKNKSPALQEIFLKSGNLSSDCTHRVPLGNPLGAKP